MQSPLLIAHRGDRKYHPENSIAAFESAFAKGADGIEMDIQLIGDKLFVVHDYLYDSSWHYLPLEEVLKKFSRSGRLEIEIKAFSLEILRPLRNVLTKAEGSDIELTCCELPLISHITDAFPDFKVGVIFDQCYYQDWMTEELYVRKITSQMQLMHAQVAHLGNLPVEKLTTSLVKSLHSCNVRVNYHIGSAELSQQQQVYKYLQKLGIDQCTFDDIDLVGVV